MNPKIVDISVVNGELMIKPPIVSLSLHDYVQWRVVQGGGILVATVDAPLTPFANGDGGPIRQEYNSQSSDGQVFPCPALAAIREGMFKYSVSVCLGQNTMALVTTGVWDVKNCAEGTKAA